MADDGDRRDPAESAGERTTDGGHEEVAADVADADDDEEWRYSVEDVSADPADPTAETAAASDEAESGGNVAGEVLDLEEDIEPGSPSVESAFFFVLGVLVTILFFLTAAGVI